MGKHYFTIRRYEKNYMCYLDEDSLVHVLDSDEKELMVSKPVTSDAIEYAKEAAVIMIEALRNDRNEEEEL